MKITINNKEYKINTDISWGLYKRIANLENNPKDFIAVDEGMKQILIPTPSNQDINNFKKSDIEHIFEKFAEAEKEESIEFKKKRS